MKIQIQEANKPNKNGRIYSKILQREAEQLKDVNGLNEIRSLLEEGKVSVRMSGIGTLTKQEDGIYKVENDYQIDSFFITNDPA